MKTTLFLLALCACHITHAQITFPVCKVTPAKELLEDTSYHAVVDNLAQRERNNAEQMIVPEDSIPNPLLEAYGRQPFPLVNCYGNHPLVQAVQLSYLQHRPLSLSPDMIWLMIAQGFAAHVDANSESLRGKLVHHEGRKVLCVQRADYVRGNLDYDWPSVFGEFRQQIARYSDKKVVDLLTPTFSTTGLAEQAAFDVSLMDAMSAYYLYTFMMVCGIPEITLEGTPEDWADLEKRFEGLRDYVPSWWFDQLQPVLREFNLAASGQVNTAFWQDIYKMRSADMVCTQIDFVSGWILLFFPYVDGKPNPWVADTDAVTRYEEALDRQASSDTKKNLSRRQENAEQASPETYGLPVLQVSELPLGLAKADLLVDTGMELLSFQLQAGFVGIRQDIQNFKLRPEINWLVVDQGRPATTEDAALYRKWLAGKE